MHIKKGDEVAVISGKDKGKRGKVLRMLPDKSRAIVEGVNMIKKHARPNQRIGVKGGIVEREGPIHVAKLMPIDPESKLPTRVGHKFLVAGDGSRRKVRVARRSGAELDR
ncbi:MAG: 50S ribosomal protein L24 [Acidobacteria bacterium]|nr:50S ribosomal protein L24 [Acidobacteriota bacterium]